MAASEIEKREPVEQSMECCAMIVGVPREIKSDEYRVAMLPVGVEELTHAGHTVLIEAGAGQGSGIADAQYAGGRRDDRRPRPPRSGPRPT